MGRDMDLFGREESGLIVKYVSLLLIAEQRSGKTRDLATGIVRAAFEDALREALLVSDKALAEPHKIDEPVKKGVFRK